jgi:uroporphyrinogen decarboxylase
LGNLNSREQEIMNGYERFLNAVRRQEPDRVPVWELIIDRPVIEALHGNISLLDFVEKEDLDGLTIFEDGKMEHVGGITYRDEWGIIWKLEPNNIFYPFDGPIKSSDDLEKYVLPDADAEYLYGTLKEAVKRFKGQKAITFISHETFEYSHYLLGGMDKLFLYYITDPDFVIELSEAIWQYKNRVIRNALEIGADIIVTGDDYAGRLGTFMSPEHFRKFIVPYLKRAVDLTHSLGSYHIKHTDGNLWKVLDDIVDTGIDVLDPIEPIAYMDIGEVKEKYGDRVCVTGNVDVTVILPGGSIQDVEEAVKETIAKASPGGGHIMASSNSIHTGVKPENYKTMVETTRKYGTYPIDKELIDKYKDKKYIDRYL